MDTPSVPRSPFSLERMTGLLKRAGVDPDTGERLSRCDVCDEMKAGVAMLVSCGMETWACEDCRKGDYWERPTCRDCGGSLSVSCSCEVSAPSTGVGPLCRCGHRNTVRVGYSEDPALNSDTTALLRRCTNPDCGEVFLYRLHDGHLLPYAPLTALALDEQRRSA